MRVLRVRVRVLPCACAVESTDYIAAELIHFPQAARLPPHRLSFAMRVRFAKTPPGSLCYILNLRPFTYSSLCGVTSLVHQHDKNLINAIRASFIRM